MEGWLKGRVEGSEYQSIKPGQRLRRSTNVRQTRDENNPLVVRVKSQVSGVGSCPASPFEGGPLDLPPSPLPSKRNFAERWLCPTAFDSYLSRYGEGSSDFVAKAFGRRFM
ncbi:uncharacterized protein LAJ45_08117 [Morchella importuna]|uniref:uncharacterized protein n=1 Tax=Morchella importuna TaxID=1174673 RepID=UPI001E8CEB35|nr:uncharacterized protein LAJ45_08117 [Morchella importuna]KAH8147653.1 hypothetical protein LAJ45_08117 [Morchella importuna]